MSFARRLGLAATIAGTVVLVAASPALAHNEFEPATAGPGTVISLTLVVENERPDAGTTQVQLFFPEGTPLTLAELPAVADWTTTIEGGAVGSPVTSVTWSRPTAGPGEDPRLPLRVGPLPAKPGRLQFKLLQTYSDGEIERWIDDWPAEAPEPEMPPVVLDVTPGGPGDAPATPASTAAPTTTTGRASERPGDNTNEDDSSIGTVVFIVLLVGLLAAGGGAAWVVRRRRST